MLPILLTGVLLAFRHVQDEQQRYHDDAFRIVQDAARSIDQELDRHRLALQVLSQSTELARGDFEHFYTLAKQLSSILPDTAISVRRPDGQAIFNTNFPWGSTLPKVSDQTLIATDRMAMATRASVISNLFVDMSRRMYVAAVQPVILNGEVAYLLNLDISTERLSQILSSHLPSADWLIGLVDNNDTIIGRNWEPEKYIGQKASEAFIQHTQDESGIFVVPTLEGVQVYDVYVRSPLTRWRIGAGIPLSLFEAPARNSLYAVATIVVGGLICSLVLAYFYAGRLLRPVEALQQFLSRSGQDAPTPSVGQVKEFNAVANAVTTAFSELKLAEERFHRMVEAAPNGLVLATGDGKIVLANEQVEKLFGYGRDELMGQSVEALVPERYRSQHLIDRKNYVARPSLRLMGIGRDIFARRKDGSEFPVEIGLSPIITTQGTMILSAIVDITARKHLEEEQQLVVRELHHRTRNLVAVAQVVANRSIEEAKTFAEAKLVINGRLTALAQAYEMLADAKWEGAPLRKIIERQLAGMSGRVIVTGCDVVVTPSAAQQFAMITHELMTNALKYGALSAPDGRVSIAGKMDGNELYSFVWKETGGPRVSAPIRKGFGSVILLDSARQFSESVVADYGSTGLTYSLRIRASEFVLGQRR